VGVQEVVVALDPHGWSTARFFLPAATRHYGPTHIHGDLLREIAEATTDLGEGAASAGRARAAV
jgi:hypothetical protein